MSSTIIEWMKIIDNIMIVKITIVVAVDIVILEVVVIFIYYQYYS